MWLELSEDEKDYSTAKKAISATLMPMEFVSLKEFHRRKLRPGEALSVFIHDTKKLLDQAMPSLEKNARTQLLLHRFFGGLPETVGRQLRATGEVKTLDTAIVQARILMTIDKQNSGLSASAAVAKKSSEVDALKQQIALLTE